MCDSFPVRCVSPNCFAVDESHIRETKFANFQFLREDGKAVQVPPKDLDEVAAAATKEKQRARERVFVDPLALEDLRQSAIELVIKRQGQQTFRDALLSAYNGQCAITGCSVADTLQAAHIVPYKGVHTNCIFNGLLLRSDVHTLFDLGMIAIKPVTYQILVSPMLLNTEYYQYNGGVANLPCHDSMKPINNALMFHWQKYSHQFFEVASPGGE